MKVIANGQLSPCRLFIKTLWFYQKPLFLRVCKTSKLMVYMSNFPIFTSYAWNLEYLLYTDGNTHTHSHSTLTSQDPQSLQNTGSLPLSSQTAAQLHTEIKIKKCLKHDTLLLLSLTVKNRLGLVPFYLPSPLLGQRSPAPLH